MKNRAILSLRAPPFSPGLCDEPALGTTEDGGQFRWLPQEGPRRACCGVPGAGIAERGGPRGAPPGFRNLRAPGRYAPRGRRRHSPSEGARPRAAAASPASGRRSMRYRRRPWGPTSQPRASPRPPRAYVNAAPARPRPRTRTSQRRAGPACLGCPSAPRVAALADDVRPRRGQAGVEAAVTRCSASVIPTPAWPVAAEPLALEAAPELSEGGRWVPRRVGGEEFPEGGPGPAGVRWGSVEHSCLPRSTA